MAKLYGGAIIPKRVRKNPGGLLTIGDIADAVAYPGEYKKQVTDRLRWYFRKGQLTPFAQETEGKGAYLFWPSEVLVAEVLVRMNEFGISTEGAAQAVTFALNFWRENDTPGQKPPNVTPGQHVIKQYEEGARDWTAELWLFANPRTGAKIFQCRLAANQRGEGTTLTPPGTEWEARAVFAVDLIQVLDRVHPSRRAVRNAAN